MNIEITINEKMITLRTLGGTTSCDLDEYTKEEIIDTIIHLLKDVSF